MSYPLQAVMLTYEVQVALRRYRASPKVYDTATVVIGRATVDLQLLGEAVPPEAVDVRLDDPRWPTVGEAGLPLTAEDESQVWHERLFRTSDGQLLTLEQLPFGAAYEVPNDGSKLSEYFRRRVSREYLAQHEGRRGLYMVKLPSATPRGDWFSPDWAYGRPDGNPQREGWTVTGDLTNLTISPSINLVNSYHGWLGINGAPPGHLSRDIEGRPY